ncbi:hypothetical protein JOQ06_025917 [Pogonophryne albipinna]|uniref:PHD-type domain-containing protein n=1 Tax=Pogonophryne albipinna TaxID=1090488 RepID=A0AAD6F3J8_9TELE|nr:hypothetical protein JOQ06_025917 [Pogonophryne albipinna]
MGRVKKGNRAQRKDLWAMAGGMEALAMKDFRKECRIPDMEEGDKLGDSPLTQEEDDEERRNAHTIVGRSPFTYEFRKVMEEVIECYIRGILNLKDNAGRLYLLDHYTMGVILHGTREQRARQELKKMAKMTVKEFPKIPKTFHIKSSKQCLQHLRRDMAEDILRGSVSKDDFCSFCGTEDLPTTAVDAVWIQCETCGRWFHTQCLGMTAARIPKKNTPWYCVLCILPN